MECCWSWHFSVSGKPILDLTSDLMTAQPFFFLCFTPYAFVNDPSHWKYTSKSFFFLHFMSHYLNQNSDSLLLLSCWFTCVCDCRVSQLSFKKIYISDIWNVTPVVSIFNVCYDARHVVCILYQSLLLDVSHYRNLNSRNGTSGNEH